MRAYSKLLGERLRAARHSSGLSLPDVEALSGGRLKAGTVSSWERGTRAITVERLAGLTALYGVPAASLIVGPSEDQVTA